MTPMPPADNPLDPLDLFRLDGQVALVTGASAGLGARFARVLHSVGARVVLTPAELKGTGMVAKAVELAQAHGWFLVRQFENEANANVHSRTTAVEILEDFKGREVSCHLKAEI